MRLTVKDKAGGVVFDAADRAVQLLLETGRPVLVATDDTGQSHTTPVVCLVSAAALRDIAFCYSEYVREQANRRVGPILEQQRRTIAAFRDVVGGTR